MSTGIKNKQGWMHIVTVIGFILSAIFAIYLFKMGAFKDPHALNALAERHRITGPLIIIGYQIIQVVIPVLPSGIVTAAAVLVFGPIEGFIYNYTGVVIGSFILFHLGRNYGTPFVKTFVPEKTYNKYVQKIDKGKSFDWFFFWMIFAPVAPDDALVLIASQTRMTRKFFFWSIIVGKIFGVAMYSYVWTYGIEWAQKLFG